MISRRGFLGGILAAACAPAIVKAESIMRIAPPKVIASTYTAMTVDPLGRVTSGNPKFLRADGEWAELCTGEVGKIEYFRVLCDRHETSSKVWTDSPKLVPGDRWLSINQYPARRNGIYVVEQSHHPDLLGREPGPVKMKQSPGRRSNMTKLSL